MRVTALQVVFDLLLTYGLEAFKVKASLPEQEMSNVGGPSSAEQGSSEEEEAKEGKGDEATDSEHEADGDADETQAPVVDTAASVLTILTGIPESEVWVGKEQCYA